MSQHYYRFSYKGRESLLMSGWDKGPQMAYIVIGYYTDDKSDWEEPFILDTDIPFDRNNNLAHVDEIIVHFKGMLERLEIDIPDLLFEGVVKDIADNNVNVMFMYDKDGNKTKIDSNPFLS